MQFSLTSSRILPLFPLFDCHLKRPDWQPVFAMQIARWRSSPAIADMGWIANLAGCQRDHITLQSCAGISARHCRVGRALAKFKCYWMIGAAGYKTAFSCSQFDQRSFRRFDKRVWARKPSASALLSPTRPRYTPAVRMPTSCFFGGVYIGRVAKAHGYHKTHIRDRSSRRCAGPRAGLPMWTLSAWSAGRQIREAAQSLQANQRQTFRASF